MSNSWRIKTLLSDNTERASTSSQTIGAMVIKSLKGPKDFFLFSKGDTQKVIDTFGYPDKDYPSIQDAIDLVSKSAVYLASPYKNGKYGGVFVTPTGTIPFISGLESKTISSFSSIPCSLTVGTGNSVLTTFTYTLTNFSRYVAKSLTISVGGTAITLTFDTSTAGTETITGTGLATGSNLNTTTGVLTLVFSTAPSGVILAGYNIDVSDAYFVLFDKNPQADDIKVKVTANDNVTGAFDIAVYRYDTVQDDYVELTDSPYTVGLLETSKDTYGDNIYINNIFDDNQLMFTPLVNTSVFSTFTDDTTAVALSGGARGDSVTGAEIASIYEALTDTNKYPIKFAVDPTASSEVITEFETLRNSYQKRCRFLYCSPNLSASSIIATPASASGDITNNRGMYCYVLTWGIHKDIYQSNDFLCSNMGLIAGRLVDVLEAGGGVPAWIDEDGVGGILGSSITKLSQTATETELEQLDTLGFNPVVNDVTYGPMIEGWKTRQVKLSVYSSIGQSSLADTLLDLIEKNVLPTRLGKLIDETSYSNVRNGCNTILNNYSRWLEDYYVLCDSTNNTATTRNNQQLNVTVAVIFKGYAEKIIFTFACYRNGVNLKEEVAK